MSASLRALGTTPGHASADTQAGRLSGSQGARALPEAAELHPARVPHELSAEELRLNPCAGRAPCTRGPARTPDLPDPASLSLLESALPRLADLGRIRALLGPDVGAALAPRAEAARAMADAIQSLLSLRADAATMRNMRLGVRC